MKRVLDYDGERGAGASVTCTLADGVLLRGPAMQQSGEDRLVVSGTVHLSLPLKRPPLPSPHPPSTWRCPALPPLPLPSSRRSPARRRPCRGSRPRPSPARRSRRWVWTRTPCCAGWPAGRRPAWGSAAAGAWRGRRGEGGRKEEVNGMLLLQISQFFWAQFTCKPSIFPRAFLKQPASIFLSPHPPSYRRIYRSNLSVFLLFSSFFFQTRAATSDGM